MVDKRLLDAYEKVATGDGEICPVCTDKIDPEKPFVIISCGHLLCSPCAGKLMLSGSTDTPNNRHCTTCRRNDVLKTDVNVYICRVNIEDWSLNYNAVEGSVVMCNPANPFLSSGDDVNEVSIDEIERLRPAIPKKTRPYSHLGPQTVLKLDTLKRTARVLREDVDKMVKKQKAESDSIATYEKQATELNTKITAARKNLTVFTDHTRFLVVRLDSIYEEIADITAPPKEEDNRN